MKIELNSPQEAADFLERLHDEVALTGNREAMGVKLDSVPSMPGSVHRFDGSTVTVWYQSSGRTPTARQIREASAATNLGIPTGRYTGKIVDVKRARDGTVYVLCGGILERRDEANDGMPAFRAFSPSKGQVLNLSINTEIVVQPSIRPTVVHPRAGLTNGASHGARA